MMGEEEPLSLCAGVRGDEVAALRPPVSCCCLCCNVHILYSTLANDELRWRARYEAAAPLRWLLSRAAPAGTFLHIRRPLHPHDLPPKVRSAATWRWLRGHTNASLAQLGVSAAANGAEAAHGGQ